MSKRLTDDSNYFLIQPDVNEEKEENYCWDCPIYFSHLCHKHLPTHFAYDTNWWKPLEKKKTVYVALVLCLHVGVDPPDITRPSPSARLECWQNPLQIAQPKPAEVIGNALHQQYERMQQRARYKILTDPISDTVSKTCTQLRKNAKDDRVLMHYNGHGVPKPTSSGEIWVFNRDFTQYIPLCILDVNKWLSGPTMYVFDCSNAGLIVDTFKNVCLQADPTLDIICFGACGREDVLPMNPELPADLFTSCLTTPIKIALRWYCLQNPDCLPPGITMESTDSIPGKIADRRTPLGELNWIFTAVTDTIGWSVLPVSMFQRLFRQDNLIAGLSRNFLLAVRILKSYNCTPCSEPDFPEDTANHPMWKAWDLVCDLCVRQLPSILAQQQQQQQQQQDTPKEKEEYVFSSFFSEQLRAFETFLTQIRTTGYQKPMLLPIVLQVLLAQNHRPRALELLKQFLDIDVQAVMSAMSVGVFPYIARLLSTPSTATPDTLPPLLCIYAKIIALDPSFYSSLEMTKETYINSFKDIMCSPTHAYTPLHRTLAAYIISRLLNHLPEVRTICAGDKLSFIPMCEQQMHETEYPLFHLWIVICLASLWKSCDVARRAALRTTILEKLFDMLSSPHEELRTATLCALGTFIQNSNLVKEQDGSAKKLQNAGATNSPRLKAKSDAQMDETDQKIAYQIIRCKFDCSEMVRKELAVSLAHFILENENVFQAKWKQLVINFSEISLVITGNMTPFNKDGRESFCIVNGNDCDSHLLKKSQSTKELGVPIPIEEVLGSSEEESHQQNGGFHVGTPPTAGPRSKKMSLGAKNPPTPNMQENRMVAEHVPGSPVNSSGATLRRNNQSLPSINPLVTSSETTEFKDLWDALISLVNDPSGSVSDIAKQVLKRISDVNRSHPSEDKENSNTTPRGILRSDSCHAPPIDSLLPQGKGSRAKGNSCGDPTHSTSRVKIEDMPPQVETVGAGCIHSQNKHTVTFNQRHDETYYYHKENPAGYFCTGFIEEYSQLMLEPFHKWPFAKANVQQNGQVSLSPTEKESYYNFEKLKMFRNNAKWRLKASQRKLDFVNYNFEESECNAILDFQDQLTFGQGLTKNYLTSFHFEPYKNSLYALSSNCLSNLDIESRKQTLCFDERISSQASLVSQIGNDHRLLDFALINSHERPLALLGNSLGCFKIVKCSSNQSSTSQPIGVSNQRATLGTNSSEERTVLGSFRGFRVVPNQPLQVLTTSWNSWTGKFLAAAVDQTFDPNLNGKAKNVARIWDLETQKCDYEATILFPISKCVSHQEYYESQPKPTNLNPNVHYFGLNNGAIQMIDSRQNEPNRILFREHNKAISYLTHYRENCLISHSESLKIWDLRKQNSIRTFTLPENHQHVSLSHWSSVYATSYLKGTVFHVDISQIDSGKLLTSFKIQPPAVSFLSASKPQINDIQHIEFHPLKNVLCVAAQNGSVLFYKIETSSNFE